MVKSQFVNQLKITNMYMSIHFTEGALDEQDYFDFVAKTNECVQSFYKPFILVKITVEGEPGPIPLLYVQKDLVHQVGCCEIDKMTSELPLLFEDVEGWCVYSNELRISRDKALYFLHTRREQRRMVDQMMRKRV